MNKISLQIDGKYVALTEDAAISISRVSPIFGDGATFSYEFDLPISPNLHLFQTSGEGHGMNVYSVLHGKPFRLYVSGTPFQTGIVKLDDETEINSKRDAVTVSLISNRMEFDDIIKDVQLQDLDIASDRIHIGTRYTKAEYHLTAIKGSGTSQVYDAYVVNSLPYSLFTAPNINIADPWPIAKYCNVRVCYYNSKEQEQARQSAANGGRTPVSTETESETPNTNWGITGSVSRGTQRTGDPYIVAEAAREASAPCFYVHYLLRKLMSQYGVAVTEDNLSTVEDFDRLALISTKFSFETDEPELKLERNRQTFPDGYQVNSYGDVLAWVEDKGVASDVASGWTVQHTPYFYIQKCIANAKGLPDVSASDFIKALEGGFGCRFLFDSASRSVRMWYVRDVLRQTEATALNILVTEQVKVENCIRGFVLTYGQTDDDSKSEEQDRDTTYNYKDYSKVVKFDNYASIISEVSTHNYNTYLSNVTGNAYRVKVNKDAGKESEWYPSLFEVGQFTDATYGDVSDEECVKTVSIGFTPVVLNDCNYVGLRNLGRNINAKNKGQLLSLYIDAQAMAAATYEDQYTLVPDFRDANGNAPNTGSRDSQLCKFTAKVYRDSLQCVNVGEPIFTDKSRRKAVYKSDDVASYDSHPVQEYSCGFLLGVMRGPGNDSGVENYEYDYDGQGNYKWMQTPGNYATTSDSCDDFGQIFDYNGTEEEGVDMENRFSLKLRAEKPNPDGGFFAINSQELQKRGLFDKMYSEYAMWVVDSRIMRFEGLMELADVINIDLTRKYRVNDYVGFIKKVDMRLSETNQLFEVTLELMYL